ncbi:MAG: 4Fe-4S binding protein [Candidatus Methanoplasma sp.]|jgi:pyruvate ferredoxin oxidoreductase delta subunit/pyruvate ferredoxin oxidoreductase gamma subunit|nr:4Fe-4S binding protein [Candidatus Methanoplasma sp.]
MKPYIREDPPKWNSEHLPESTSFEAGFLVAKNAGWRNIRPVVITEKCVGCLQCYLHCPDGTIFRSDGKVGIDYDFCKGCGICKKMCKFDAIVMEAERT